MAMVTSTTTGRCMFVLPLLLLLSSAAYGQLSTLFYSTTCPSLETTVRSVVSSAINSNRRMGASLLRLHFHDCFVQGCDASILLDDIPGTFVGEKNAGPNANSVLGFDVINNIKTAVEANCPGVVSCADIVALAARDGVNLLGGPTWNVPLGRRDSTTASQSLANSDLPAPTSSVGTLIQVFANKGLSATDMTALSGAHTIGFAQCQNFRAHIYNDNNINQQFAKKLRSNCAATAGATDTNLAALDVTTQLDFDNAYFRNLIKKKGLLHSDQELFNGGSQDALVQTYSNNPSKFASDFVAAMIRMGNIRPLTGTAGQIRADCTKIN